MVILLRGLPGPTDVVVEVADVRPCSLCSVELSFNFTSTSNPSSRTEKIKGQSILCFISEFKNNVDRLPGNQPDRPSANVTQLKQVLAASCRLTSRLRQICFCVAHSMLRYLFFCDVGR